MARYLSREDGELRLWAPMAPGAQRFWHLLKRRATRVCARTQLKQSLTGPGSVQSDVDALLAQCNQTIVETERGLKSDAKALGWTAEVRRCQVIRGIGPLTPLDQSSLTARFLERTGLLVRDLGVQLPDAGSAR